MQYAPYLTETTSVYILHRRNCLHVGCTEPTKVAYHTQEVLCTLYNVHVVIYVLYLSVLQKKQKHAHFTQVELFTSC